MIKIIELGEDKNLRQSAKDLYYTLVLKSDERGIVKVSNGILTAMHGFSDSFCHSLLRELEHKGYIERHQGVKRFIKLLPQEKKQ